jgi:hypothetical protein
MMVMTNIVNGGVTQKEERERCCWLPRVFDQQTEHLSLVLCNTFSQAGKVQEQNNENLCLPDFATYCLHCRYSRSETLNCNSTSG